MDPDTGGTKTLLIRIHNIVSMYNCEPQNPTTYPFWYATPPGRWGEGVRDEMTKSRERGEGGRPRPGSNRAATGAGS